MFELQLYCGFYPSSQFPTESRNTPQGDKSGLILDWECDWLRQSHSQLAYFKLSP